MHRLIEHPGNLRDIAIPFYKRPAKLAELISLFLIQCIVPLYCDIYKLPYTGKDPLPIEAGPSSYQDLNPVSYD